MRNRRLRNKISQSSADHRSQLWYRSRSRGPPGWTGHQTGSGGQEAGGAGVCEEELSVSRGSVSLSNRLAHWTSQTLSSRRSSVFPIAVFLWQSQKGRHQKCVQVFVLIRYEYEGTLHCRPDNWD